MQIDVGSSVLNCFVQLHVKHTITEGTQHKDTVHILINQGVSSPPCPASSFWFPVPVLLCTKQCELKLKQHHLSVTSHVNSYPTVFSLYIWGPENEHTAAWKLFRWTGLHFVVLSLVLNHCLWLAGFELLTFWHFNRTNAVCTVGRVPSRRFPHSCFTSGTPLGGSIEQGRWYTLSFFYFMVVINGPSLSSRCC